MLSPLPTVHRWFVVPLSLFGEGTFFWFRKYIVPVNTAAHTVASPDQPFEANYSPFLKTNRSEKVNKSSSWHLAPLFWLLLSVSLEMWRTPKDVFAFSNSRTLWAGRHMGGDPKTTFGAAHLAPMNCESFLLVDVLQWPIRMLEITRQDIFTR